MSKTKTVLAATGGIILIAVVAMGFVVWCSMASRTEAIEGGEESGEGLDAVVGTVSRLGRKTPYPCEESVKELVSARNEIAIWKEEAFTFSCRGDRASSHGTSSAFKEFLIADARRLADLPEGSTNKFIGAAFEFGPFKPYIKEGNMPAEQELKDLQRKWGDITTILEKLYACGVSRATGISVAAPAAQPKEEPVKGKKPKRGAKKAAAPVFTPDSQTYTVTFLARPSALVKTLNAFETSERFMVVTDFSFHRERDAVAEVLGGTGSRDDRASSSRGRGRGRSRGQSAAQDDAAQPKITVVTDPQTDAPLVARLTVTVHDFKSREAAAQEEDGK